MKKFLIFISLVGITIGFFIIGCKPQGEPFVIYRKITSKTMINGYGAYVYMYAEPDSVLYSGIHVAKLWAYIFNIPDTIEVLEFGHVWSIDNPNPTLRDKQSFKVFTSDSVNFSPTDSILSYVSTLTNLELDTGYFARSFVIFRQIHTGQVDTAYNQTVKQFRTAEPRDIWFVKNPLNFLNATRTEAISFVINNKAFIGLGCTENALLSDIWSYNPETDEWTQYGNFRGGARCKAVAFVLNDTVYVGTGVVNLANNEPARDFWKWNEALGFWLRIDSMPKGTERYDAVAFSAYYKSEGLRGFVGTGKQVYELPDFYMYNPVKDTSTGQDNAWTKVGEIPARYGAVAASDGRYVIIGGGKTLYGYRNDFYVVDMSIGFPPAPSTPPPIDPPPAPARYNAVAAIILVDRAGETPLKYFYYGTGQNDTAYFNDWYAYDFAQGKWEKKSYIHQDFIIGKPRGGAVSFVIEKAQVQYGLKIRIFVLTGYTDNEYLKDVWEYLP